MSVVPPVRFTAADAPADRVLLRPDLLFCPRPAFEPVPPFCDPVNDTPLRFPSGACDEDRDYLCGERAWGEEDPSGLDLAFLHDWAGETRGIPSRDADELRWRLHSIFEVCIRLLDAVYGVYAEAAHFAAGDVLRTMRDWRGSEPVLAAFREVEMHRRLIDGIQPTQVLPWPQ